MCYWKLEQKRDPCYMEQKNLELCFAVMQKAELTNHEHDCVVEQTSKQSVVGHGLASSCCLQ